MFDHAFNPSVPDNQAQTPVQVGFAVLTVSDTRTIDDDSGGQLICEHLGFRGHNKKGYNIVPDDGGQIRTHLSQWLADPEIDAIIVNGGTGIAGPDITLPVIISLFERQLTGFGELFRMLIWEDIGSASMLSRATAGIHGKTVIFSIPDSTRAVRLALGKLIGPELGNIVHEIKKQF